VTIRQYLAKQLRDARAVRTAMRAGGRRVAEQVDRDAMSAIWKDETNGNQRESSEVST
jgi:hypothetical protein